MPNMILCYKCRTNTEKGKPHKCIGDKDPFKSVSRSREVTNVWRSKRWLRLREYVYTTYGEHGCARCHSMDNIQLHHITKVRDDISKAYDIDNVCILCSRCHNYIDKNLASGELDFKFKRYEYQYNIFY